MTAVKLAALKAEGYVRHRNSWFSTKIVIAPPGKKKITVEVRVHEGTPVCYYGNVKSYPRDVTALRIGNMELQRIERILERL